MLAKLTGHRPCVVCGKLYWPIKSDQKYCSLCRLGVSYYRPKPKRTILCKGCGKEFSTHRKVQKFHSTECKSNFHFRKVKIKRICRYCKKSFTTTDKRRYYCCLKHYIIAKHERDQEYYEEAKK